MRGDSTGGPSPGPRDDGGHDDGHDDDPLRRLPIMTRAGTAFHSSQKVMKELVTRMMPGMNTVVK